MTGFTKGPWEVKQGYYPGMLDIKIGKKMNIAVVTSATDLEFGDTIERTANAHLIATSPRLYNALKQAVTSMLDSGYSIDSAIVVESMVALAQARGETE